MGIERKLREVQCGIKPDRERRSGDGLADPTQLLGRQRRQAEYAHPWERARCRFGGELRATGMAAKAGATPFQWPPHYDFPPFFSKQPNRDTNARRVQLWKDLILGYCAHHRVFSLSVREALASSPLFYNEKISRRLRPEVTLT